MKEISNISKSFTCECGATNRFEFETDFDVHDVRAAVRCQACGRERTLELMNFFRKNPAAQPAGRMNEFSREMIQPAAPAFTDMVSDYGQPSVPDAYSMPASNSDFQQAIPTNFMDAPIDPAPANAMNMFEADAAPQYQQPQTVQPPQSQYAGLLDLAQEHLDNANTLEGDDGIYEPFGKERENAIFGQEPEIAQPQTTNILNPVPAARRIETEEDSETFSALFGNL